MGAITPPNVPKNHVTVFLSVTQITVDEAADRETLRFIAISPAEVPLVLESSHSAFAMVSRAVANGGRATPPPLVPPGLRMDAAEYLAIPKELLIPWL